MEASKIKETEVTALLWKAKTQPWLKIASITADEKLEHLVERMHLSGDTFEKVLKHLGHHNHTNIVISLRS